MVVAAVDIVEALRAHGFGDVTAVTKWLTGQFPRGSLG